MNSTTPEVILLSKYGIQIGINASFWDEAPALRSHTVYLRVWQLLPAFGLNWICIVNNVRYFSRPTPKKDSTRNAIYTKLRLLG